MAITKSQIKSDYFTFDGRISAKQYTISFLILLAISALMFFLVYPLLANALGFIGMLVIYVIQVLLAIASFSIAIRRLHDVGQTGWLSLLLLVPVVNLALIIYLCVAHSSTLPNKYGI